MSKVKADLMKQDKQVGGGWGGAGGLLMLGLLPGGRLPKVEPQLVLAAEH
jgi:hypothetical protein